MRRWFREHLVAGLDGEYVTGLFSDALDRLGHRSQVSDGWLVNDRGRRVYGRVRTLCLEETGAGDPRSEEGVAFLGRLDEGDALVIRGSRSFAYFGELLSRLALRQGLAGVVVDGLTRDSWYTRTSELPIFARGYAPTDIRGRGEVGPVDVPIELDGVVLAPGDFLFGDGDALVVLPEEVLPELLPAVNDAARREARVKEMIRGGASIAEILAFTKEL